MPNRINPVWFRWKGLHLLLSVHIQVNTKQSQLVGIFNDRLKIRLAAQAIDGKANTELSRFLARQLNVASSKVIISKGTSLKYKQLDIELSSAELPDALKKR